MGQLHLHDPETIQYITNLLTEFVQIENMYRVKDETGQRVQYLFDMLTQASNEMSPELRRDYYKHSATSRSSIWACFPKVLLMVTGPSARIITPRQAGDRTQSWRTWTRRPAPAIYRKLSEQFQQCVVGLNWVKLYINDPFYQYMFRRVRFTSRNTMFFVHGKRSIRSQS